jgi:hypothetical protein
MWMTSRRFSGLKANIHNLVQGGLMDNAQHAWWTTFLAKQESTDWAGQAGVSRCLQPLHELETVSVFIELKHRRISATRV